MNYDKTASENQGEKIRKIDEILSQLTPENIQKQIKEIQEIELPLELQKWVQKYEKVGDRDPFIWSWTYSAMKKLTLSSVIDEYRTSVLTTKSISIILNTVMDDIADRKKNKKLLNAAIDICYSPQNIQAYSSEFSEYLGLIKGLWETLNNNLKDYPKYKEFRDLFLYDYQQFFNSMQYSCLINRNPHLINPIECEIYSAHNMQGIIAFTIDLMCSPKFDSKELGILREIAWKAQRMGRIGNSITTWKRELYENDFSSEIFAYSIKNNIIMLEDLKEEDKNKIIKNIKESDVEKYLLERWEEYYNEINRLSKKIVSINIQDLLIGLENLIAMHLISRGLK